MQIVGRPERDAMLQTELKKFQSLGARLSTNIREIDAAFAAWTMFTRELMLKLQARVGTVSDEEPSEVQLGVLQDAYVRSEETLKKVQAEYDEQHSHLIALLRREIPKASSQEEIMTQLWEIASQENDGRCYPWAT